MTETQQIAAPPRYGVELARTPADIRQSQRLRYRIFAAEMGAQIDDRGTGMDVDSYDPFCRHLLVKERASGRIIACTRILTDDRAGDAGGFYSEGEFELDLLDSLPGRAIEIGRTCVDPDFRNGAVIATLWSGLADFVTANGYDYLFGCASVGLQDGGANARAVLEVLRGKHLAPSYHRVQPRIKLPQLDAGPIEKVRLPPLLKAYVSLGAKACGEPYWDRDFNCADVFMLLNVGDLCPRYARRFLGRGAEADAPALA
jgi:putative hemolysin